MKGGLKPNAFVTSAGKSNCCAFETKVRSTGVHLKFLGLIKSFKLTFRHRNDLKSAKNIIKRNLQTRIIPLSPRMAGICSFTSKKKMVISK